MWLLDFELRSMKILLNCFHIFLLNKLREFLHFILESVE